MLQVQTELAERNHKPVIMRIGHTDLEVVTDPRQIPTALASEWMSQVTDFVAQQNYLNAGSMYDRGHAELMRIFNERRGVTLLQEGNVAYFSAMLPRFAPQVEQALGSQIVEVANVVVNPEMKGRGLGKIGNSVALGVIERKWPDSVSFITTESRAMAASWAHADIDEGIGRVEAVDWAELPYFTGLTCQYAAKGESAEHICALKRRDRSHSNAADLVNITHRVDDSDRIPCTLMVSNMQRALAFQERARILHEQLGGEPVIIPVGQEITDDDVLQVDDLYARLVTELYGKRS